MATGEEQPPWLGTLLDRRKVQVSGNLHFEGGGQLDRAGRAAFSMLKGEVFDEFLLQPWRQRPLFAEQRNICDFFLKRLGTRIFLHLQ